MKSFQTVAIAFLLAGCSESQAPSDPEAARQQQTAVPTSAPSESSKPTSVERVSQYTKLTDCKTIEVNEDEAYSSAACPGKGGYALEIHESDLRQTIVVISPDGKKQDLQLASATRRGGFNYVGDVIEWRGVEADAAFRPEALILRFNVTEDPEHTEKSTSYLLTAKLNGKPCVTAMLAPRPEQNKKARVAADQPEQMCMPIDY